MNKTLVVLDSSAFSNSACMLNLFYTVVMGYTSKLQNNDVEFGTAFHKFRKIFRDKGEQGLAEGIKEAKDYFVNTPMIIKSNKTYLTSTFLMRVCLEYAEKYNKSLFNVIRILKKKPYHSFTDKEKEAIQLHEKRLIGMDEIFPYDEPLLELRFAFPYYVDDEMEILMAGTIDELGKHNNGIVCICDAKTTSMWKIRDYFNSYELKCQLRFYKWALLKYAAMYPNSFIADLCKNEIGCFIDGIFYKGAEGDIEYKWSDVMLFQDDPGMVLMDTLIHSKVSRLITAIKNWRASRMIPLREGILINACENPFGPCRYSKVCSAVDNTTRDVMLEYNFIQRPYNPMNHGE